VNYKLSSRTIKNLSNMYTCLVSVIGHNTLRPLQGAPIKTTHPKRYCISAVVLRIWTKLSVCGCNNTLSFKVHFFKLCHTQYIPWIIFCKKTVNSVLLHLWRCNFFPKELFLLAQPVHITVHCTQHVWYHKQLEICSHINCISWHSVADAVKAGWFITLVDKRVASSW